MLQSDLAAFCPILVLAPLGRDAAEIQRILDGMGVPSRALPDLTALCRELQPDSGAAVAALFLAEEAIAGGTGTLVSCLEGQPPWSDLPIMVLTTGGRHRGPGRRWVLFEKLGNVSLVDRPMHVETLQSAVRAVLRARARQHQTREHLEALRFSAETLDARVQERTAELMAVEETLRHVQKMEAIGQLTGGIAHDFNNLLQGISGSLDLMKRHVAQGRTSGLGRYIDLAQGAANRAAALTHRLLAFARRQALDPKPTQANRLIADMVELIRRTVGPSIVVHTKLTPNLCTALCDPHQLENALLNVCLNARDAMPEGGRLTIETTKIQVDGRTGREQDIMPGDYAEITVSDTGTGMSPDVVERAFDPFFTTKPLSQGTGLGLSMVYGFAGQSRGKARISSEVGRGTTVSLLLPCHVAEPHESDTKSTQAQVPETETGGVVLVVDDESIVRALVVELLVEMGFRALEAEDGPSALEILHAPGKLELLITDVGLPGGMNGRQVAEAAQEIRPGLEVLFITGYAETVLGDGQLAPGMHVMTKPFTLDGLAIKIRDIVEGGKTVAPFGRMSSVGK